ncbi:tyrosine-tyramine antiporter [Clostridium tarantellae]|uniref:Amino acid permease n=1 Tax=Clostridium tarantellae TaxID=39493 RepID=A0A6I1MM22_9CLOT|nr:tyrosine-tyramine antiporter [Clostridium tarantellae]MPQ43793.1 amino acid permease [Clostridium tarantellae]
MADKNSKKITLFQLIAISIAFYGSIRNVPTVASAGWEAIFFMIGAGVLFAIPISLIAAELATGWPEEGGPQVWVNVAMGEKWAFVTAWLLWIQMMVGTQMGAAAFGSVLSYAIGKPELAHNNLYIFIIIIVTYWTVTFLNFKGKVGKWVNTLGSIVGICIPFLILSLLGIWYFIKHGNINLGPLNFNTAIPNITELSKLSFFAGICFIFAGLEIASVQANNIDNPKKNYPKAVFISVGAMVIFNLIAGLTEANAIPDGKIQLANITQPFQVYFNELGIPWMTNVIGIMICIGLFAQMSAWVLGPSEAMIKVAEEGNLPTIFQKRNKDGIPITFVLIQAIAISLLASLFIIVPQINTGYFMVLILTTILYSVVYLFIILAVVILRYKKPEVKRAFNIPGGKIGMWITSTLAFIGVILIIIVSLIPSNDVPKSAHFEYVLFQILATLICIVTPIIIFKFKKPSWKKN